MSRDHTEAATITPEANPSSAFCSSAGISFFMKKTKADPSAVPAKGIRRPIRIASISIGP